MSNDTTPLKRCSKCQHVYPAKATFFYESQGKLTSPCRACRLGWNAEQFQIDILRKALAIKGYRQCTKCDSVHPATTEFFQMEGNLLLAWCRACVKSYHQNWTTQNIDKTREYRLRTETKYPEKTAARKRMKRERWRAKYPEKVRALKRRHKQKRRRLYPEIVHANEKRLRLMNPQKLTEQYRKWRLSHPDNSKIRNHRRRALLLKAEGSFTQEDIDALYVRQSNLCAYCGNVLVEGKKHIEHIKPISRNGTNYPDNLCISCDKCNFQKKDKTPEEWVIRWYLED